MKNLMKRIVVSLLAVAILLAGTSCEKTVISVQDLEGELPEDRFFGQPTWVICGTVEGIREEYFTNPNSKLKNAEGVLYENAHITVYEVAVKEVYKGDLEEKTVLLSVINGSGLSKELYLHGEDRKYILDTPVKVFSLEEGHEYLLGISRVKAEENHLENKTFDTLRYGDCWCFEKNEKGLYENKNDGMNHKELSLEDILEKIKEYQ